MPQFDVAPDCTQRGPPAISNAPESSVSTGRPSIRNPLGSTLAAGIGERFPSRTTTPRVRRGSSLGDSGDCEMSVADETDAGTTHMDSSRRSRGSGIARRPITHITPVVVTAAQSTSDSNPVWAAVYRGVVRSTRRHLLVGGLSFPGLGTRWAHKHNWPRGAPLTTSSSQVATEFVSQVLTDPSISRGPGDSVAV